jgi:glycosyltransferase involved in cell wall biosynthesis
MHPWFGSLLGNRSNDALLVRSVRAKQAELGLRCPVVVITVPVAAGVLGKLGERASLYYRVDDFALWPGYSSAMIRRREELLLRRVSGLLVTAQGLRVPSFGKPQALLDHGVDLTHFGAAPPPPPELTAVRDGRPLLLFAGRIDERIDPTLLRNLPGQVVLIGRQTGVRLPPDVTVLPTVTYAQLPAWLSAADVLLLPYTRNRLTDTIQPLKLREYLATGRPIATTDLPEVGRLTAGLAEIGDGPEGFAAACTRALAEDEGRPEQRRRLVAEDGWSCRATELLQFVGRL